MKQIIKSISEYKDIIESKGTNTENEMWIYRGQSNPKWDLTTSLYRYVKENKFKLSDKNNLDAQNILRAHFPKIPSYKNELFDPWHKPLLSLGQHYGFKTNLLDWTVDPFFALFFALDLDPEIVQFKIFGLKVTEDMVDKASNKLAENEVSIFDPAENLPKHWHKIKYEKDYLLEFNRNLKAQLGLFTYNKNIYYPINRHYKEENGNYFEIHFISDNAELLLNEFKREKYESLLTCDWALKLACERANKTFINDLSVSSKLTFKNLQYIPSTATFYPTEKSDEIYPYNSSCQ